MTAVALRTFSLLAALLIAGWLLPANLKAQPAGKRPAANRTPRQATPAVARRPTTPLLYKQPSADPFNQQLQEFGRQQAQKYAAYEPVSGVQFSSSQQVDPFTAQKSYNPAGFNPGDVKGNQKRYKRR